MAKKKGVRIFIIVLCVVLVLALITVGVLFFPLNGKKHIDVWGMTQDFNMSEDVQSVKKTPGEKFKILLITDIQLWSNISDNNKAYDEVRALVEKSHPNLILTLGDNVSGVSSRFLIKEFIGVMDSFKIPWAPIYGNHDNEIPMTTLNWQGDKYEESEYCLFKKGPSNLYGCGNYVINITENDKPIQSLFMMDNGRYTEYDDGSKGEIYMGYEQIAWYEWNVKGIAEETGKTVPSMVFTHFAQPQFKAVLEEVKELPVNKDKTEDFIVPEEYGYGTFDYTPGVAKVDSGFFQKCKELDSTKYLVCGHDHENDASVTYDGITMTYGLKTGPSPAPWNNATEMGGTVITLGNADSDYAVSFENIVITKK